MNAEHEQSNEVVSEAIYKELYEAKMKLRNLQSTMTFRINTLELMRTRGVGRNSRLAIEVEIETYEKVMKLLNQPV